MSIYLLVDKASPLPTLDAPERFQLVAVSITIHRNDSATIARKPRRASCDFNFSICDTPIRIDIVPDNRIQAWDILITY
ncbi:hypothetical protein [Ectopseudomonas guguanensis]|jgi:hypothetical protein|uniref:hypothetical protein n=1 Tax=Ectopseudomonas guguanensis TaxID=1198456 RepID=UPI003D036717